MVGRQKQKRSRVKKRFASAEPNGSVASIRSYGFAHVQCRVMCEASQNLSSFTLRLNRAPDGARREIICSPAVDAVQVSDSV